MIFATNNAHKLQEVSAMLGGKIELKSLLPRECKRDVANRIPETGLQND